MIKIYLLFYMCHFAMGLTHCYKTTVFYIYFNMNNKNMDIKDLTWNEISSRRFNNPLFPKSIRGILDGKSACGKTTLLLNFLLRPGWLDYIYGKSLFQPEYRILKKAFEEQLPKESILRLFQRRSQR